MGLGCVGDHGHLGSGNAGEVVDLAGTICPHLNDRKAVILLKFEQGKRHPDIVIEVAGG